MSASGDFGPAPPGVDLSENQNGTTYGAIITIMIIGTIAVALRAVARTKQKDWSFAVDDYLIFAALTFAYGTAVCTFVGIPMGNGHHLWVLTKKQFTSIWLNLYAYVIIYATAVTCTKASIVCFYKRVFNIKWSMYVCLFFVIGYWIVVIVTINVGCIPLSYFWEQWTDPTAVGHCIDIPKFFLGNGIGAMLIDVMILCVPVPIVWNLQMPTSQKVAVIGILMLGGFVCVASIVRIIMLDRNVKSIDLTWTISPVFVWSCVEPFIGILCACLPTFAPFFRRWWGSLRTTGKESSDMEMGKKTIGSSRQTPLSKDSFRMRGNKPEWDRLDHDDELNLTNHITGPPLSRSKASSDDIVYGLSNIAVKQDVDVKWDSEEDRPRR